MSHRKNQQFTKGTAKNYLYNFIRLPQLDLLQFTASNALFFFRVESHSGQRFYSDTASV